MNNKIGRKYIDTKMNERIIVKIIDTQEDRYLVEVIKSNGIVRVGYQTNFSEYLFEDNFRFKPLNNKVKKL